jgi:hypothetical protein
MYKRLSEGGILRLADSACIPEAEGNTDYRRYLADVAEGATVLPADPPPVVYSGSRTVDRRLRTTNATSTEIFRATLAQVTLYRAELELLGVDAGNGNARYIRAYVVTKRLVDGALMVGAPAINANLQDTGASTWAIAAAVSGNDFVITVAGQAGRSIDWHLSGSVASFTPAGV